VALGLSQKKLSEAAGVDHGQYMGLETMRISPLRTLRDFRCKASGCPNNYSPKHSTEFCAGHLKATSYERATWREIYRRPDVTAWTRNAEKLAVFHGVEPGDLFPEAVLSVKNNRIVRTIDGADLMTLLGIADQTEPAKLADEEIEEQETAAIVRQAVTTLPPRERKILEARFGLSGGDERTLKQVGDKIGVSQERVRD
jgi:RNA polymerase sigma factor (sigma-70 family)